MQIITVNNIQCDIQAYKKDDFVNLCPINQDRISSVHIRFEPLKISTSGKETKEWKEYISGIDVKLLKETLEKFIRLNLDWKDLRSGKEYQFLTSSTTSKIKSVTVGYIKKLKAYTIRYTNLLYGNSNFEKMKKELSLLCHENELYIEKEKWIGPPTLAEKIHGLEMYRDTRDRTTESGRKEYEHTDRQINEVKEKYYD